MPIPTIHVKEQDEQIWGGEGIVQGFIKRHPKKLRVPRFWIPVLKRSVVYSEILDKHISVVVTERAIRLINEHYGFDHYILKVEQFYLIINRFIFKLNFVDSSL